MSRLAHQVRAVLGIPHERCDLAPEPRGCIEHDGLVIEKWVWTSEPGNRVPSLVYRPAKMDEKTPAIVITNGHGGSKNALYYRYTGQLYAKLGLVCVLYDTIGEEERHSHGLMGTRAHDDLEADACAAEANRLMMGKMVFDTMRALDFLCSLEYVDDTRLGLAGSSLGAAVGYWMIALEPRLRMAVLSGFGIGDYNCDHGKRCTRIPSEKVRRLCSWVELLSIAAPNCAVQVMNGRQDRVLDEELTGEYFQQTDAVMHELQELYAKQGYADRIHVWYDREGGHRAYQNHKDALLWIHRHLGTPNYSLSSLQGLPEITLDTWCANHGLAWEEKTRGLYWTDTNHKGAVYADLDIKPLPVETLSCLRSEEVGASQYTLEGWLDQIRR